MLIDTAHTKLKSIQKEEGAPIKHTTAKANILSCNILKKGTQKVISSSYSKPERQTNGNETNRTALSRVYTSTKAPKAPLPPIRDHQYVHTHIFVQIKIIVDSFLSHAPFLPPSFVEMCQEVFVLSCWQTNQQTNQPTNTPTNVQGWKHNLLDRDKKKKHPFTFLSLHLTTVNQMHDSQTPNKVHTVHFH